MSDVIDYNKYMKRAMVHMISEILSEVAEEGLPGDHHFYISFLTGAKGVDIPGHLYASYPEEMTIVLQGWFADLAVVNDDRFAVTLSFHGKAENLVVPFSALTRFADPSVQFQLQLDGSELEVEDDFEDLGEDDADAGDILNTESERAEEGEKSSGSKVIQLDSFRKP